MCAHFQTDFTNPEMMAAAKAAAQNGLPEDMSLMLKHKGEVFPGCIVPVMTAPETFLPMEWGFPQAGKEVNYNARSEGAAEHPMFKEPMLRQRCVVPATGFYETWHKGSREMKYFFRLPGSGIMYLAGCWKQERKRRYPVFTLLTREAVGNIADIHHRMPVLIQPERVAEWLCESPAPMKQPVITLDYEPVWPEGSLFDPSG